MSFKVKALALRLKEIVSDADRESFAQLVSAVGVLEADAVAFEGLITKLAPRFPEVDLRGLKNRAAAELLSTALDQDAAAHALASASGQKSRTTRPADDIAEAAAFDDIAGP